MKIALIGYGKMGRAIEEIALKAGHSIVCKISNPDFLASELTNADIAIEFTRPEAATSNILKCFDANIPVVVGTTGWYNDFNKVSEILKEKNQALFYATNFSLGVNIFFELNKTLAQLMNPHVMYEPSLLEAHHLQKKDAPSGTAITLAEDLLAHLDRKKEWVNREMNENKSDNPLALDLVSIREGEIPGTHTITYCSEIDEIVITHQAFNRMGFASGAVKAAEWMKAKKGIYSMADMLGYRHK